tara:strand:- start:219 stop:515 length:297 start_codon:yes stop_codon:yes gene_type:complete
MFPPKPTSFGLYSSIIIISSQNKYSRFPLYIPKDNDALKENGPSLNPNGVVSINVPPTGMDVKVSPLIIPILEAAPTKYPFNGFDLRYDENKIIIKVK